MKVILISGPSGSGKTTLSKKILTEVKNGFLLSTNYYKTGFISNILSKFIENYFDRKIILNFHLLNKHLKYIIKNNKSMYQYSYNFKNKKIQKTFQKTSGIKYLIIEGIFAKYLLYKLKRKKCFFFELKIDKTSCLHRVINRDVSERGKNKEDARNKFLKSWQIYHKIKN